MNESPGVTVHRQIRARQRGIGVYNRAFITANVAVMAAYSVLIESHYRDAGAVFSSQMVYITVTAAY